MNVTGKDFVLLNNDQIISKCHELTAQILLIALFSVFILSFLVWGLFLVKESRGKLLLIIFYSTLTSFVVFGFLYLNPHLTQLIIDKLS